MEGASVCGGLRRWLGGSDVEPVCSVRSHLYLAASSMTSATPRGEAIAAAAGASAASDSKRCGLAPKDRPGPLSREIRGMDSEAPPIQLQPL
jgi:hypothetical protein